MNITAHPPSPRRSRRCISAASIVAESAHHSLRSMISIPPVGDRPTGDLSTPSDECLVPLRRRALIGVQIDGTRRSSGTESCVRRLVEAPFAGDIQRHPARRHREGGTGELLGANAENV